jgi:methionyl-tRNA formyltransferase
MERPGGAADQGEPPSHLRDDLLKIVFAGTPDVALPSFRALLDSRHEVVAAISRPDAPAGRGRALHRSPVAVAADEAGIEVLTPTRPSDPAFLARLQDIGPDLVPVVAYGALVPPAALSIPAHGWINLHFSLLPAWRGAAPVQHAIWRGDEMTGASVFQIEAGLDTGPVFGTLTEPISLRDTAGELLDRLAGAGSALLGNVVDLIDDGAAAAVPQSAEGVSLAPKLSVTDARVVWTEPALAVDRRIRACTPAPAAWTTFRGERLRLGPVLPCPDRERIPPGEAAIEKHRVLVGTATHPVLLGTVQPAGRKAMAAADWARGIRAADGEMFGEIAKADL